MAQIWQGESKSLANMASGGKISTAKYTVNDDYIIVETGVLSTSLEQYPLWAVRDVDYKQSLIQKTRGVSTFVIRFEHNDFTGKPEITFEDVSATRDLVGLITSASSTARLEHQRLAQTQHVNYQGQPPVTSAAAVAEEDVFAKIEKLGALLDKGLITAEEFASQKARLLG
jgi:uncharacterized membrane protein YdbT with pleckstrin-like domain